MSVLNKCLTPAVVGFTVLLAACGGSGGSSSGFAPPPDNEQQTSFTGFVETQFAVTADDTDPIPIESLDFDFDDQGDPGAFDTLLEQ